MTYQPDFSGVWAKLDRAEQHRKTLEGEVGHRLAPDGTMIVPETNRIPLRLEYERETGYHVLRLAGAPPSEDAIRRWGIIIGEAVHNLRSALDHLVWQLALFNRGGREPQLPNRVQFPITNKPLPPGVRPEDFASGKDRPLWEVRPDHRAIIYEHQPHGSRFDFSNGMIHPFLRLNRLSNDDKHRVITPVSVMPDRFTDLKVSPMGSIEGEVVEWDVRVAPGQPLEGDAEIMAVRLKPPSLQLNMEVAGYLAPNISFRYVIPHQVVPGVPSGTPCVIPIHMELMNIALQASEVIREFHELSY